jgi:hypothetical protein
MLRTLVLALSLCFLSTVTQAQLAYVTFVHNSPDPALEMVDVYVTQTGQPQKIANIAYQNGSALESAFIFGGLLTTISVAPANSVNEAQAVIRVTFTPEADKGYAVVVSGVQNPANFVSNPSGRSIGLSLKRFEVPIFSGAFTESGVQVYHGATDLETADFRLRSGNKVLASALKYDTNTVDLINVNRDLGIVDVTMVGNANTVYGSFSADFASFASEVVLFVLSGFKTPLDNNSDASLVLLAVLDDGRIVRNDLIAGSQVAKAQLIHNSADPEVTIVDVYADDTKIADNIAYLKATAFNDIAAGSPLKLGIAPALSTSSKDVFASIDVPALRPGRNYHFVISGVKDTTKYKANPDGQDRSLTIIVAEDALPTSSGGMTSVRSINGSTDATNILVQNRRGTTYMDHLGYTAITGYQSVEAAQDTFWLLQPDSLTLIKGWVGNLSGNNRATCLMATGFVDPASNQNGQAFKLVLVDANGNVSDRLTEVTPATSVDEVTLDLLPVSIAPNPVVDVVTVRVPHYAELDVLVLDVVSSSGTVMLTTASEHTATSHLWTLGTTSLAQGTYVARIRTSTGLTVGSATFVVQR